MELKQIKQAAFKILARREYSRVELARKLQQKFAGTDPELIQAAIEQLISKNFQNDQRYAEAMVRHRASQGYGPAYIRQLLKQQGVSDQESRAALAAAQIDWQALAQQHYLKHFGGKPIRDFKERAKRMRYLYSRGFLQEIINTLLGED